MANEPDRTLARSDEDHSVERLVAEIVLNSRRRYALYYVHEHSGSVSVDDLAVKVAAWERATMPGEVVTGHPDEPTADQPDELVTEQLSELAVEHPDETAAARGDVVASSLRRRHLPYLEDRGFVTFDRSRDRVIGHLDDPTVELYVTNDPRTTVAWHKVYLALTLVATVFLGLSRVGIGPFGELGPVATAGLIVVLYAVVSVAYWFDVYRWRRQTEEDPPDFLVSLGEEIPFEELEENRDDREEDSERENSCGETEKSGRETGKSDETHRTDQ